MFRHEDVILRECVITLLKSLSLLLIVFSHHFVSLLCVLYICKQIKINRMGYVAAFFVNKSSILY